MTIRNKATIIGNIAIVAKLRKALTTARRAQDFKAVRAIDLQIRNLTR